MIGILVGATMAVVSPLLVGTAVMIVSLSTVVAMWLFGLSPK